MASKKIKGITIQYEGDTTRLESALSTVEKKGRSARSEMSEVNRALKEAPDSAVLWQQKQELLNKALESSKDKLKLLEDAQGQVRKQFENKSIGEEQYRAFEREIERARADTQKLGEQISDTEKNIETLSGETGKAAGSLDRLGDSAEKSSEGFTVLKGAAAELVADGFEKLMKSAKEAWEEVDKGYDTIIVKTGATGDVLKDLQNSADNVFTSIPVEMDNVGDAIGEINTRYALTGKELESLTSYFLEYSKINNTQVASSVRNVAGIMKAFQEDTANASKVLDVFTDVGQRTGKDINSLESELLSNSATFKELGLDIRQSAELLGQFEANGVDVSTALSGLKKAQQNATAEGKTLTDSLGETIERIKGAKDETEALQIATDLFGKKGAAAMAQAIREQRFSIDDLVAGYDSMKSVVNDTFTATQDAPDKAKAALNKLKIELTQLGEKVLPIIEKIAEKGVDDFPKIERTAKNLLPLIKGIGTAYASWKIAATAQKGAETVKGLTTAMKGADGATKLLNSSLLANPAVAVTAGVVGLTVALGALYKAQEAERDIEKQVNEKYKDNYDAVNKARDELKQLKDDYNSRAGDIESESRRTKDLWEELEKLADASGNVQSADKKRAEYILGELNSALGTEYELTDNQIVGYRELAAEIDNVIEKKKAETLLNQYMEMNSAVTKQNIEAQEKYEQYSGQYQTAREQEATAKQQFEAAIKGEKLGEITPEKYLSEYDKDFHFGTKEGLTAAKQYAAAKQETATAANLMQLEKANFDASLEYLHKLNDAERAYAEERYDDVKDILYASQTANKSMLADTKSSIEQREKAYKAGLEKLYADIKLYSGNWRQKEADAILDEMKNVIGAAQLAGIDANKAFDDTFKKTVQKMLDKGFDISKLAEWAKDSGLEISEVFGDEYMGYIQDQLDKGYDTHDLLEWAFRTGGEMSKEQYDQYLFIWRNSVKSGFSDGGGVDISGMLAWAQRTGRTMGEISGENFSRAFSLWTQDLYANNNLINRYSINSESDARYWKEHWRDTPESEEYFRNLGWYATGGFINIGHEGIVAEAGPELLQVMNGGVKVTPLSHTATNTPVGAGGDTIINNYYYTVYADIDNDYDAFRLAEQLGAAERRLEEGKGQ